VTAHPTATATHTASPTNTHTVTPTPPPTSTSTPTPSATPTLPRLISIDFGNAGTGGIPCITTTINFQLLAGADNVLDLRVDFCADPEKFDVPNITCQAQSAGATIDPVEHQLSCDLQADDPHGQVRVTAHGIGVNALPAGQVLFNCSVPVLPSTTTGVYNVDYSIRGNTTGDQAFVDFGQSTISIFADSLSQGQCCGVDSQCSSGFCRGGFPDSNSACCENECANGVCNDPLALGTCLEQPGGEFHVSTVTYRSQLEPAVATLHKGFVVAWHGSALDYVAYGSDIFARRYDQYGAPVAEITVNEARGGNQRLAKVAPLFDDFVVVWSDPYGVYGRRFDVDANALGGQFQVNTYAGGYQYYTAVDSAGDGSFVVAWDTYGQDGDEYGIFAQRFDSAANDIGTEFQVNTYTYGSQSEPTIRINAVDASFVIVWQDHGRGAVGQRFDSGGMPAGTEIVIPDLSGRPGLDVADDGSFVVVGENFDGSYFPGLFARLFDSSGAPRGQRFQVNTYTFDGQTYGSVALDGTDFVVVWQSFGQDGYINGIFGQRFDSKGVRIDDEFLVNRYTAGDEKQAAIAADDSVGGFVVVWQGNGGSSVPQILGQRLP
jgi:hypothetical protein